MFFKGMIFCDKCRLIDYIECKRMKYESYKFEKLDGKCEVQIPVSQSYRDCISLIKSDYYREYARKASLVRIWLTSFLNIVLSICCGCV